MHTSQHQLNGFDIKETASSCAKNPVLVGLCVGILLAVTGVTIPLPLRKAIDMLANAAGPAALFVIGGTLFGLQIKGMARDVSQIVIGKLILHPLVILIVFLLVPGIEPIYLVGALLFSAAPMISIYPLLGQRYDLGGISAAAMLVATVASFYP